MRLLWLFVVLSCCWGSEATEKDINSWISLAYEEEVGQCERLDYLTGRQRAVCVQHNELMNSVRLGARVAVDECRHQFAQRRWNCTLNAQVLQGGTREAAFVKSITAAGVAFAVTQACSSNVQRSCGCDQSLRGAGEGFQWAGCSDNIDFGIAFSGRFADVIERNSRRGIANLHNNQAGRKTIAENMRISCKCHGVSGSCETRTCWRSMPTFREVGRILKDKFDGATLVVAAREAPQRQLQLRPKLDKYKWPTPSDLVYLKSSPDFCVRDDKSGSPGTRGRICNDKSLGPDGCQLLCCGRGYRSEKRVIEFRCNCKFFWCCDVKCDLCSKEEVAHSCL